MNESFIENALSSIAVLYQRGEKVVATEHGHDMVHGHTNLWRPKIWGWHVTRHDTFDYL
jgi:hypothetical protein